ncbi:MAG: zinc-dependent metalloprotease [Gemmatimonadota bacterium]
MRLNAYVLAAGLLGAACAHPRPAATPTPATTPAVAPAPRPSSGPQPYDKVITRAAKSDAGLFTVHTVDAKRYFEIPDSLLERDMLWLTRLSAAAENLSPFLTAGSNVNQQLVRWSRDGDRMLLRSYSFRYVADSALPIARSLAVNTFAPIIRSFRIEAFGRDSHTVVIDVSSFFDDDVAAISGMPASMRTQFKVRRMDPARSFVESLKSFPLNIEVRQVQTFDAAEPPSQGASATVSIGVAQSLVLLPREPMRPRAADARVGWFTTDQIDFGSPELKAASRTLIRRWRLEPKDPAAYARGELVEPVKPIVFYLDPGTPAEWRPFIRQGVQDWQRAFEAAGFKNAILAKDPPTAAEDPEFDPDDVRYSSIRYVANMTRNAMGPSVSDPRTGEIIESDILWFHNHLRSYRNRLMVETGAANPDARSLHTAPALIGETVRQVIAHEVGHALGLPHNMIGSSSFPVDSLRSPTFTAAHGVSPSIMDYARQNYVAQPGDGVTRFVRMMGPYDFYAINWGYRIIPGAATAAAEKATLDRWILEKANDPMYRFAGGDGIDPRAQTEDIGDDPVRASRLGIANLRRVAPMLPRWTATAGEDYEDLNELYGELVQSYARYLGHVVTLVGGVYRNAKTTDQAGPVFEPVPAARQREAIRFFDEVLFTTPTWLVDPALLSRIENGGAMERVRVQQSAVVNQLLDPARLGRMTENAVFADGAVYSPMMLLADLRGSIWKELAGSGSIDPWRRQLQRIHVERLRTLATADGPATIRTADPRMSDVRPLARGELVALRAAIQARLGRGGDEATRRHLSDVADRITETLEAKK